MDFTLHVTAKLDHFRDLTKMVVHTDNQCFTQLDRLSDKYFCRRNGKDELFKGYVLVGDTGGDLHFDQMRGEPPYRLSGWRGVMKGISQKGMI